jgi:hypothetical protein
MNYLKTKLLAFLTIFSIIAGLISSLVVIVFFCIWLLTGVMPSRILFLELVIIPTLIIQLLAYLHSTTKKS